MRLKLILAAMTLPLAFPAMAALAPGATAPDFTAQGALAGKPFTVNLKAALATGPVVLYFFPAAFTEGCSVEAKAFADASANFKAAGATVIGMTAGNVHRLAEFSKQDCANKFAVAAASDSVIDAYDVRLMNADGTKTNISDRTSYVIAPNGRVLHAHTDRNPLSHIQMSLAAVRKYKASRKSG